MDLPRLSLTDLNRGWLDQRYLRAEDGTYFAHEPIYGLEGKEYSEPNPVLRYARIFQVLRFLNRMMPFQSLLDVGGAEGFVSNLARKIFGVRVVNFDLSKEANHRACEIFGLDGVSGVSHELPFKTRAFDVVLCIEVIEHLQAPLQSILELNRVSSKQLIVSSASFCLSQKDRKKRLAAQKKRLAAQRVSFHFDRNYFLKKDFKVLLGPENLTAVDQYRVPDLIDLNSISEVQEARQAILRICSSEDASVLRKWFGSDTDAQIMVKSKTGSLARMGIFPEERLLDAVLTEKVQPRQVLFHRPDRLADDLQRALSCPDCRILSGAEIGLNVRIKENTLWLLCEENLHQYPIEEGVPLLYPSSGLSPRPLRKVLDNIRHARDVEYLDDLDRQFSMLDDSVRVVGYIEEPLSNSMVRGSVQVRGWALDIRADSRLEVEALLDGKPAGRTRNLVAREDVVHYFRLLGITVSEESGFTISLDNRMLPGTHNLRILAKSASGEVIEIGQTMFQYSD
jgi:uncharacterized protein YbaR (Trm112 family)